MPSTPVPSSGPRTPGLVFLAITAAIGVTVGIVAVATNEGSPPTVAEFSPKAVERIDDAPDEQASDIGEGASGTGSGDGGRGAATGDEAAPPIDVPRVLRCVGTPPRQIDDPQSPPCVPFWEGDNGGATAPTGVTATEITVAWPLSIEQQPDVRKLEAFFNSRFQFYGRKVRLQPYGPAGGATGPTDPTSMKADATGVDEELGAFASLMYVPRDGAERHYYDELARRGIVSVDARQSLRDEAHHRRWSPYQWTSEPAFDVMMRNTARWLCAGLVGAPAAHAGPDVPKDRPRSFGLLVARSEDGTTPDASLLRRGMTACDATPAVERELGPRTDDLTEGQNVVLDMKLEGVTSVICLCPAQQLGRKLMPSATGQGYNPEWLLQPFQFQDRETSGTEWPQAQASRAFGISFRNKWLAPVEMPWFWAMREIDPDWQPDAAQQGWTQAVVERYAELLVLASGIQLAGPRLDAASLRDGLQRARFPNPACGREPYFQACVGFDGDHAFHQDATVIWWNPTERNHTANQPQGAFCYANQGARYDLGSWTRAANRVFTGACR